MKVLVLSLLLGLVCNAQEADDQKGLSQVPGMLWPGRRSWGVGGCCVCMCPFCGFFMWIHKPSHLPPAPSLHLLAVYLSYWVSVLSLLCIRCDSHIYQGFLDSSVGKEPTCNAGDPSLIPELDRSAGEGIGYQLQYSWASLVVQLVKNPPAMWETWVGSLGWEDPLGEGKAAHSSILAQRRQSMGSQRIGHDWVTLTHSHIFTALVTEIEDQPNRCWIVVLALDNRP